MKAATVYERDGKIYLHASSKTDAGVWIASAPFLCTSKSNEDDLSVMIRDCLNSSRQGVSHPQSWGELFAPILSLAKVKSVSIFNKSAKCVEIELDGSDIKFLPTANEGLDGFVHIHNLERHVPERSNQLGAHLISALADAQ